MPTDNKSEIVIFKTSDDKISVDVRFEGETVWLSQQQMSELYQTSRTNIVEHIKHSCRNHLRPCRQRKRFYGAYFI